ncbi:LOW QUALITY PROTEIN: laccase-7-like [Spinacia oleracea]|uniref:Laccase n=1 Tax=Spinacia oleracea TaxID=3562 RepID=A0A9R0I8V1_SPIOL|nr:LOW QUALITY PROTEIN: laccase-7-like [Spinacia oleracea]
MLRLLISLAWVMVLLESSSLASASVVEHSFYVKNLTVEILCEKRVITAVNGSLPGPLLKVREGDTVIVHVFNESPYNISIHWHGLFQKLTPWADGPSYITQCPIKPGQNYTYNFNATEQEGTLWWHAHSKWLRATVYGGFIILPRKDLSYPFAKPHQEFPIIIGEWWNANVLEVEQQGAATGAAPNISDAYTINGQPGHLYSCSQNKTTKFEVVQGKTYLLRIINAALNNEHFFKVANHNFTVVAIDATYTTPYETDVVVTGPGQTVDVLMTANQPNGSYYAAAQPYSSAPGLPFDNTTTTAIFTYVVVNTTINTSSTPPIMPSLPAFNDTPTAHRFFTNLTGLTSARFWEPTILDVDEHMFMAIGLGLVSCGRNESCLGIFNQSFAASINNISFQLPTRMSLLEAHYSNVKGVYDNATFPDTPLMTFDYTNPNNSFNQNLLMTTKSTTVKRVKFNTTIEIVFQDTALVGIENHPMHIHCFNFQVLAQGFGNYNPSVDRQKFNLVNPQIRNTVAVPTGGWSVIRFRANNPGVWILHCHLDVHLTWGLAMAFIVEDGGTPESTLPPPPADLPKC